MYFLILKLTQFNQVNQYWFALIIDFNVTMLHTSLGPDKCINQLGVKFPIECLLPKFSPWYHDAKKILVSPTKYHSWYLIG